MKRKALIIGSPGQDLPGVKLDMDNYKNFFQSPLGGAWLPSEITTLENPGALLVNVHLRMLQSVDYSVVIFAGHGRHSKSDGSTYVQLQPSTELNVNELKKGAKKHTLIVDCCRVLTQEPILESFMAKAAKHEHALNTQDCRILFEKSIEECPTGLVVMYACDIDETAGESKTQGGYYSSSLISAAKDWQLASNVDTSKNYAILPVTKAHNYAAEKVRGHSGNRQNPTCEYPRSSKHFPFAIIA